MSEKLDWPLMQNNIGREDLDPIIEYLKQDDPILTHGAEVLAFEQEWSAWIGVRHSVMVNSGSSANLLTLTALRELEGDGEIIVPPLTWVSDIASVLQCGFKPVFVDIDRRTLAMGCEQVLEKLTGRTRAVFLTHILGFNGLTQRLLDELTLRDIPLIEDVCESYGATFQGRKVGSFGWAANFSFYYAHHMTTVEGGMISTNDEQVCDVLRMLRSHGMVREAASEQMRRRYRDQHPDLNSDFIFAYPGYNVRPTEINALMGRSQLKRLDTKNANRSENLELFLSGLDPDKYQTDFVIEGSCNYALTLVLRQPDAQLWTRVDETLRSHAVEFRRGLSGGGNQLRQPYLRRLFNEEFEKYPNANHVHFFGCYIGNYPELDRGKISKLCEILNRL